MQTDAMNHVAEAHQAALQFHIHINRKAYVVTDPTLTGEQLKQIGGIPGENQLFMEHGGRDTPISDHQGVAMENGLHFYDVAPGTFGRE